MTTSSLNDMTERYSPPVEVSLDAPPRDAPSRRRSRSAVILALVLLGYSASYIALRNRGLRQMEKYDNVGILYTDFESTLQRKDLTVHLLLAAIYAPANALDCELFGGEHPIRCIMFELG